MDYEKVIKDFNNNTIDRKKWKVVMDNDGGYWNYLLDDVSDEEREELEEGMKKKYGCPDGYNDIIYVLNSAGVNSSWC